MAETQEVVVDKAKWQWSEMWKKEDWWAIWIGFFILIAAMFIYFPHTGNMKEIIKNAEAEYGQAANRTNAIKTIAWYQLSDAKKSAQARKIPAGKWLKNFTHKTHKWSNNPLDAFFMSQSKAEAKAEKARAAYLEKKEAADQAFAAAKAAEARAEEAGFENQRLNKAAANAIDHWRETQFVASKAKEKTKIKPYNQIGKLIGLGIFFCVLFGIPMKIMGTPFRKFALGFTMVYGITLLAWFFSYQTTMKHYGIGYAAWAIFLGMLISNTVGTPKWATPAIQTEYYIKTGLVLLGAKILFEKIITIGTAGIFVAWVVTPT
ncbi:MAG TPA: putative sulfate exporter family transporter, partial [Desulfobacteraceae bacterium]|nr:putative sulfate exporter family transporter [Desulfobacteraceae bacterium]